MGGSAELALHARARTLGGALKATMRTGTPTVPFDFGAGMEHLAAPGLALAQRLNDAIVSMWPGAAEVPTYPAFRQGPL